MLAGMQQDEPLTPLAEAAGQIHETFTSMTGQGFTKWQACVIVGVMLAQSSRQE